MFPSLLRVIVRDLDQLGWDYAEREKSRTETLLASLSLLVPYLLKTRVKTMPHFFLKIKAELENVRSLVPLPGNLWKIDIQTPGGMQCGTLTV
ncbi:hypothetical protein EON65_35985 [archaeon]|nr:MAG: hypothetical protein EON65_35985 [archaeon]